MATWGATVSIYGIISTPYVYKGSREQGDYNSESGDLRGEYSVGGN